MIKTKQFSNVHMSLALVLGACQSSEAPDVPEPPATEMIVAGPHHDLGSSTPLTRLGFTNDGGVFRAGYLTHSVAVRDGIVDITPRNIDRTTGAVVTGGVMSVETTAIKSEDTPFEIGASDATQTSANVIQVTRNDIVEEITNRDDGVEQAWRFPSRPVGDGDLMIEVTVTGHHFVVANESGIHFASDQGLGFKYGHAVWRDQGGNDWDIPARYEGGEIVLQVPADVLSTSSYPAVLDPTITSELFVDSPTNGTTGTNSRNSDVASDGTNYFVVWQDQRDDRNDDIWGARVGANGVVTDLTGIRINNATGVQQNPSVAFVGNGYVVAWENVVATGNTDIVAAFVSTTGTVTQLGTIAGTTANETGPAIAGRGSDALLAWSDGANVRAARFTAGAFGAAFNVAAGANVEKDPAVSANPAGNYLVAFTETVATGNDDIRGQMVTSTATLSGAVFNITNAALSQDNAAATFNGTNHVVVWTTGGNIQGARVSAAGALVDATPLAINSGTGNQLVPDVSCTAAACMVVWQDSRNGGPNLDVFGALTTSALAVTTNDIAISTAGHQQLAPTIALAGTAYLATWGDNRDFDTTYIRGSRISATGAVQDATGFVIARSISNFQAPAIAQSTTYTDVFFSDSQNPDVNLVHVRFDGAGAQADNPPKTISNATASQIAPAATTIGGTTSLVVWQDSRGADRDIYAARATIATGAVVDPAGIPVTTATGDQFVPKIASSGTSALAVWQDRRNNNFDIFAAVISSTGTVTTTDIPVCTGTGDQTRPNVAYDSVNNVYLVVWTDAGGATLDIKGARVSPTGTVLDANCGAVISGAAGSQFTPDLAYGSGQFMVVWEDRRNDPNLGDIYGARVTVNGAIAVLDPNGIAIAQVAGSAQAEPSVAFGTSYAGAYIVVWSDQRNFATTKTDIFGTQVSTGGGVGTAFAIANTTENETTPDISAGASISKPFNVAYLKTNTAIDSTRIQFRHLTLGTVGGQPCTLNSQCETGFCADSKCCNTACGAVAGGGAGDLHDCQACAIARGGQIDGVCGLIQTSYNYVCRDYASTTCDLREYCNGSGPACPPDVGQNQGKTCTKTGGGTGTCPLNTIAGAPHLCQ